jgi:hypothetical protein
LTLEEALVQLKPIVNQIGNRYINSPLGKGDAMQEAWAEILEQWLVKNERNIDKIMAATIARVQASATHESTYTYSHSQYLEKKKYSRNSEDDE